MCTARSICTHVYSSLNTSHIYISQHTSPTYISYIHLIHTSHTWRVCWALLSSQERALHIHLIHTCLYIHRIHTPHTYISYIHVYTSTSPPSRVCISYILDTLSMVSWEKSCTLRVFEALEVRLFRVFSLQQDSQERRLSKESLLFSKTLRQQDSQERRLSKESLLFCKTLFSLQQDSQESLLSKESLFFNKTLRQQSESVAEESLVALESLSL